jgi:leucyl/phenylalanyl-tRNA--protein transferase
MDLTPEILLKAYAAGIFPMADAREAEEVFWVDPKRRGILPLFKFHLPRRLKRTVLGGKFFVTTDQVFADVIAACAQTGNQRNGTWINRDIQNLFERLHELGFAHSIECWQQGNLVGGLYGLSLGAAFFGESMFTRTRDASKVALVHLVARLRAGGYSLLDTQFVTEHLARFGAVEVSRPLYHRLLTEALARNADFYCLGGAGITDDSDTVVQLVTQTS